jgi:hypothetical protein
LIKVKKLKNINFGRRLLPLRPESSAISPSTKKVIIKIYESVILPVVPYECENWSLTLREEHRLRVFEDRVLRKMF